MPLAAALVTGGDRTPSLCVVMPRPRDDGRVAYRLRKARRKGATHLVMTPVELIAAVVPPPRAPPIRFAGVLPPSSSWRASVVPAPPLPGGLGVGFGLLHADASVGLLVRSPVFPETGP